MPAFSLSLSLSALVTALAIHAAPSLKRDNHECASLHISIDGDTCDTLGVEYGLSSSTISNANTFLDCCDIWPGTHICIPAEQVCKQTYLSIKADTCESIDKIYGLMPGTIKSANSFLDCADVWVGTPICVPDGPYQPPSTCKQTYYSLAGDTCEIIEDKFLLPAGAIKSANDFVTCNDIWTGTPICVPPGPSKACKSVHVAVPGDTCETLDAAYNLVPGTILGTNRYLTCSDIWPWTKICIPDGPYNPPSPEPPTEPPPYCVIYKATAGDTCITIAHKFGVHSSVVSAANPTINCEDIDVGADILVCATLEGPPRPLPVLEAPALEAPNLEAPALEVTPTDSTPEPTVT